MSTLKWLEWTQRMQAIAQTGLTYSKDPFDRERFEAIKEIAAEIMAAGAPELEVQQIRNIFDKQTGYATPKIDLRAAVIDHKRILMVREREDGGWSLPGGWADIGSTPSENVVREVLEESGYKTEVLKLAAFFDRDRRGHPPIPFYTYKAFYLCRLIGGEAAPSANHEIHEVGFFPEDQLPPLSLTRVTAAEIHLMFEHQRYPKLPTTYD